MAPETTCSPTGVPPRVPWPSAGYVALAFALGAPAVGWLAGTVLTLGVSPPYVYRFISYGLVSAFACECAAVVLAVRSRRSPLPGARMSARIALVIGLASLAILPLLLILLVYIAVGVMLG